METETDMPRILDLVPMPDGRVGVVLNVPPDAGSSITLWTEAEREANLLEAAKADDAIEFLEQQVGRMRDALQFIASQEALTFAECSVAEEIVRRAKAALEQH
jgi:hypothetical protein